jgi:hypothetical protein
MTGPERTPTDNTMAALACSILPPSQVTTPPDLTLGAGGRQHPIEYVAQRLIPRIIHPRPLPKNRGQLVKFAVGDVV